MAYLRCELKSDAKEQLSGRWGSVLGSIFSFIGLYVAIVVFFTVLIMLMGVISPVTLIMVTPVLSIISVFIFAPIYLGCCQMGLSLMRTEDISWKTPYGGYQRTVPAFLTYFFMSLFIFLWTLLLVIPGIIKTYSYAMTLLILADDENISPLDAITKSRKMMDGHKWELFVLQISFILWFLLGAITCGIAYLYVYPYYGLTLTNFYGRLKAEAEVGQMFETPEVAAE